VAGPLYLGTDGCRTLWFARAGFRVESMPDFCEIGTLREFQTESNLSYHRARYYDQNAGRFLREDPIRFRAGINFYSYVHNNPAKFSDPRGLWAGGLGGTLGGIIGVPSIAGGGEGSCATVIDGEGNIGLLCCLAFGAGTVIPAGGSLSLQGTILTCPNCKTICDMEGGFVAVQVFGAAGEGAAGGGSVSLNMRNATISVSGGPAGGAGLGADIMGGSCTLVLGGKKCKDCPAKTQ